MIKSVYENNLYKDVYPIANRKAIGSTQAEKKKNGMNSIDSPIKNEKFDSNTSKKIDYNQQLENINEKKSVILL